MILHRFGRLLGVLALALAPSFALAQTALQEPCFDTSKCKPADNIGLAVSKLYQNDLYLQSVVNSPLPQVVALQAQLASLQATVGANSGVTPGTYGSGSLIPVVTVDLRGRVTGISTVPATQPSIAAGTISANLTGANAPPSGSSLSAILDSQIGSTRATIAVRGASTWGAYTPGTSGCTFQFNGTDTVCATSSPGTGAVRFDAGQGLTSGQQAQGRSNIAAAASGANTDITSLAAPALGAATATTPAAADSSTKVPTTAFLTSATVRGDVAQSLTSAQQAQARTNIGQAVAVVANGGNAASSYRKWSDGLIEQWFVTNVSGDATVTLPQACTATVQEVLGTVYSAAYNANALTVHTYAWSATGFSASARVVSPGNVATIATNVSFYTRCY